MSRGGRLDGVSWDGGSDGVSWDGGSNSVSHGGRLDGVSWDGSDCVSHSGGLDSVSGSDGWDALRVCLDPLQPCAVVTSTSVAFEGRGGGLAAILKEYVSCLMNT